MFQNLTELFLKHFPHSCKNYKKLSDITMINSIAGNHYLRIFECKRCGKKWETHTKLSKIYHKKP